MFSRKSRSVLHICAWHERQSPFDSHRTLVCNRSFWYSSFSQSCENILLLRALALTKLTDEIAYWRALSISLLTDLAARCC
uniref:Uncharacterized protein n=1 Tax=Octopus bimaculoides TaxID=37653 RepID=A0A0L8GLJ5_OCTBM